MRIVLHIGPAETGAAQLQKVLAANRDALARGGVLFPKSPGAVNHTRLYMAMTDPDHVDPLRFMRGYANPDEQARLRQRLAAELSREIAQARPQVLILSASQLGASLHRRSELARLNEFLRPFSGDIEIVAYLDDPAKLLARFYSAQVMDGRLRPLDLELDLARENDWWRAALEAAPDIDPAAGMYLETQAPPFWLDFVRLQDVWEDEFGAGTVKFQRYETDLFASPYIAEELRGCFGLTGALDTSGLSALPAQPSAATVTRARHMNQLLQQVQATGQWAVPRRLWRSILQDVAVPGVPIDAGSLTAITERFTGATRQLAQAHPVLGDVSESRAPLRQAWTEADPQFGYRASQYLLGHMWRIEKATRETNAATDQRNLTNLANDLSASPNVILPPAAMEKLVALKSSRFAPHNRMGAVNEEALAAAYAPIPPRRPATGSTGNVIVACMKNEAPYIIEWIAHHRAIGIDHFLIYTNDCSDGTDAILRRLDDMGVVSHRNNDNWRGRSPQQHALNQALTEPVVRQADWIVHIDVDEFINVRTGNGTLHDFLAQVPDATNVAMTWRLFGHNGVTMLTDDLVIDQFDGCAPKYCPKPHTVWGFKTMSRNIGAYAKLSCHRPNKLNQSQQSRVKWVNGSGRDMTSEVIRNGWRNSKKSIGYDLLQLNHYAVRSAESFLIKRQRGRALHVDRSIGLNYWIRMDWSDFRDITIKRNIPRVRAQIAELKNDDTLRALHDAGFAWHQAKAAELRSHPEFQDLYEQVLSVRLSETERAAYAMALDMES